MPIAKEVWFVVADSERARLLRGRPTAHGRLHVDEVDQIATTFTPGEHQRPDRLGQPGRPTATGHEHEEKLAHFGRELAKWLQKSITAHAIQACPLFAPSHMLGALRKEVPKALTAKLREHTGEIAGLTTSQLADHPKITALLAD